MDQTSDTIGGGARFTAGQIAERLGCEKRTVLLWFRDGCPHISVVRGTKQRTLLSTMDDVTAWLRAKGLDVRRPGAADPAPRAAAGGEASATDAPGEGDRPRAAGTLDEHGPLVAALVRERVEREFGMLRVADLVMRWLQAARQIDRMLHDAPQGKDAGEMDRWAGAFSKLSKEFRQLDEMRHELEVRHGRWVERTAARRIVASAAEQFAADLAQLGSDLARDLLAVLEPLLREDAAEEARRVLAVRVRETIDAARARRAESIRAALDAVDAARSAA